MMRAPSLAGLLACTAAVRSLSLDIHNVPAKPPAGSLPPILSSFVSYSIEHAFWPDFAGNLSHPNTFSENLLDAIGKYSGSKPVIRVGGNSQDYALWDPDLEVATNATYGIPGLSYPNLVYYGPSYFESYATFKNTRYIHGFNMGNNKTEGEDSLLQTVARVCAALKGGRLEYLELGNEPDQFKTTSRGIVRPEEWGDNDYVEEWLNKTRAMKTVWDEHCPGERFEFIGPSMASLNGALKVLEVFRLNYTQDGNIRQASAHNYIGSSEDPKVTLSNSLLNHTETVRVTARHRENADRIMSEEGSGGGQGIRYVIGEGNSLSREGRAGLSDTFGAALWAVDFGLSVASQGAVSRFHLHQGTNYRYSGWQPIDTAKAVKKTRPPFYGHVALAAALGDSGKRQVRVSNLTLSGVRESAYAVYENDKLARIAVVNLNEYNATIENPIERPLETYSFRVSVGTKHVDVQRLSGAGSDATTGLSFDGFSFNHDLNNGKPVRLHNVTAGEKLKIGPRGVIEIDMPWSSFAILNLYG